MALPQRWGVNFSRQLPISYLQRTRLRRGGVGPPFDVVVAEVSQYECLDDFGQQNHGHPEDPRSQIREEISPRFDDLG